VGRRPSWSLLLGIAFMVVSALALYFDARGTEASRSLAVEQRNATAAQGQAASAPVLSLCGEQSAAGEALRRDARNPCGLAAQIQAAPVAGPPGDPGRPGERGATGEAGAMGPAGPMGPMGPMGPAGKDGEPGTDGTNGTDGSNGADGANGQDGAQGPGGPAGPMGPAGPAGGSCREGEVRQSYTYPDGVEGSRCVTAPPPAEEEETTSP
jgi:hypothetical protein